MNRPTKPRLARNAPLRLVSNYWRPPETEATRLRDENRNRPSAGTRTPKPTSDYVAQGVKVGYEVLEAYLRRGQEMARSARALPGKTDLKDPADALDRGVRLLRQYSILMMELSETLIQTPDMLRELRRKLKGNSAGNNKEKNDETMSGDSLDALRTLAPLAAPLIQSILDSKNSTSRGDSSSAPSSPSGAADDVSTARRHGGPHESVQTFTIYGRKKMARVEVRWHGHTESVSIRVLPPQHVDTGDSAKGLVSVEANVGQTASVAVHAHMLDRQKDGDYLGSIVRNDSKDAVGRVCIRVTELTRVEELGKEQ